MSLDPFFKRLFGDDEATQIGSGWVSGVLSVLCGLVSLGAVLCFRYPGLLTTPAFRGQYPVPFIRGLLGLMMGGALGLGVFSAVRRRRKTLAMVGVMLAAVALLLGGSAVPLPDRVDSNIGIGLDWFLLNLLLVVAVVVPLERAAPRDPDQQVFRPGWTTDGVHFLVSHLLVQLFAFLAFRPALTLRAQLVPIEWSERVSGLPIWIQCMAVLCSADLTQYAVHRLFHRVPALWRFHAVHHSSEQLDWLAGSRLHLLDALLTRTVSIAPAVLLGFSPVALAVYLTFVSLHAVLIHANLVWKLEWLEPFLVTPRIHHFHHAREVEAVDRNFAVHLPVIDRLLGTQFLPAKRWPTAYGLEGAATVSSGWWGQLLGPLRQSK